MAGSGGSGEPLPVELGALYTVEERLDTFTVSHCSWPFDSGPCTPLKMAEAGFYFCGTDQAPDWVRCVVCHHDMEGWEATDDPRLAFPFPLPTVTALSTARLQSGAQEARSYLWIPQNQRSLQDDGGERAGPREKGSRQLYSEFQTS